MVVVSTTHVKQILLVFFTTVDTMGIKRKKAMTWVPDKIRLLRAGYAESQEVFCRRLGVTVDAYRLWEQGRGQPSGPAQLLLSRLEEDLLEGKVREMTPPGREMKHETIPA